MSVKVTISHSEEEELEQILNLIKPMVKKVKQKKEKKGGYYRTYVDIKN